MALILNIETSTTVCSVCLAKDGEVIAHVEGKESNEHAGKLTLFIEQIISGKQMAYADLDAVAVSSGPGSYTGLRIGTSAAKGLCYALNKPLLSVPTLMALAENIKLKMPDPRAVYMPVMDAGRMDIYTAIFDFTGRELQAAKMVTVNIEQMAFLSTYPLVIAGGNAARKVGLAVSSTNLQILENVACSASGMAAIAERKFRAGNFEDLAYFQPFYLHEFLPKVKAAGSQLLN